jgi:hypothetical protein
MENPLSLKEILQQVQLAFRDGPPNGWILDWDLHRYFSEIEEAAAPYPVINYTSFDYSYCNHYQIHDDSEGCHFFLTILVSFITPVYSMHWTRLRNQTGAVVLRPPAQYATLENKIAAKLKDLGLMDFPLDWSEMKVEGVHLELSEPEDATLGKFLFRDFDG